MNKKVLVPVANDTEEMKINACQSLALKVSYDS